MRYVKNSENLINVSVSGDIDLEEGQSLFITDDVEKISIINRNIGNIREIDGELSIINVPQPPSAEVLAAQELETLIEAKKRELAIAALKSENKLDANCKVTETGKESIGK